MANEIKATIEGFGEVTIGHHILDWTMGKYLPASPFRIRQTVEQKLERAIPFKTASEGLLMLAYVQQCEMLDEMSRLGYEANM